jgi:hypothetical protein
VIGADADATGAGGGGGSGLTAHHRPADRKSAAPNAGSHIGVFGSSSTAGGPCGSLMGGQVYHTWLALLPRPPEVGGKLRRCG